MTSICQKKTMIFYFILFTRVCVWNHFKEPLQMLYDLKIAYKLHNLQMVYYFIYISRWMWPPITVHVSWLKSVSQHIGLLKLDVIDRLNTLVAHCKCHDPWVFLHSHLSTRCSTCRQISMGDQISIMSRINALWTNTR